MAKKKKIGLIFNKLFKNIKCLCKLSSAWKIAAVKLIQKTTTLPTTVLSLPSILIPKCLRVICIVLSTIISKIFCRKDYTYFSKYIFFKGLYNFPKFFEKIESANIETNSLDAREILGSTNLEPNENLISLRCEEFVHKCSTERSNIYSSEKTV